MRTFKSTAISRMTSAVEDWKIFTVLMGCSAATSATTLEPSDMSSFNKTKERDRLHNSSGLLYTGSELD